MPPDSPAPSAPAGTNAERSRAPLQLGRASWLSLLFVVALGAVAAFQIPLHRFDRFAFFDSGGELAIQDLLRRGDRPTIDFGYQYGLLSLLLSRLWYGIAGLSPGAFRIEVLLCMFLSAWGMARFAAALRLGPCGIVLMLLAIPDLLLVSLSTLVQTLEQALLVNALAEQARGRRATALALITGCCFVKPALAFVQGLALVVAILVTNRPADARSWIRLLGPAALTGACLGALLGGIFGWSPLLSTLFPRTGLAVYHINNLGFFWGSGSAFWRLPNAHLRDYFRYEQGYWLLGTALLCWGAVHALWQRRRRWPRGDEAIGAEIVLTCAFVHVVFVTCLFGHHATWVYSLPMLILGLATLSSEGRWWRSTVWLVVVLILMSDRSKAVELVRRWRIDAPSEVTAGLWASPEEHADWSRVLELARGERAASLAMCDGVALLEPAFASAVGGYFVPGNPLPAEARRKAEQLANASLIVSAYPPDWLGFEFWPEFRAALEGCTPVVSGPRVWVYRRASRAVR